MSQFSSSSPMRPLSIGNVVTAGLRIYRSHLKSYFQLALKAYLWIFLPLWVLFVPVGLILVLSNFINSSFLRDVAILISVLGGIPLFIYGWAKYAAISGIISRLVFGELVNHPESVSTARSKVMPRLWSFLRIAFQVGISLFLVCIGMAMVGGFIGGILVAILAKVLGTSAIWIMTALATILIFGVVLVGFVWFYSRWVIAEVPLAVEDNINGGESVARSWDLTRTAMWRIQGIVLVAFIITFPIVLLFNYLPGLLLLPFEPGTTAYGTVYLITFIISLVGGIFVMPFWQAIKAVIYYDLRSRREGLGLNLRDRNI